MILGETAGAHRFRSKDAYARFTGTAPIPVWSGNTDGTVRLNRGGNRAADSSRITPVPNDDLELRLTTLEHEVARLREDAAAARALAALADRDVAEFRTELRGHHHVLSALRETQLEQGQKIDEHSRKLDEHSRKLDEQGREMREGFATLATGMAQITALLTSIAGPEGDGN